MARQKQRHHFVTQLLIVHLCAVFVLRFEQHRQQVAFVRAACAAFGDDAKHDAIDLADGVEVTTMTGRWQAIVEDPLHCRLRSKRFYETGKYLAYVIRVARDVGVEERFDDDFECRSEEHTSELQSPCISYA